MKKDFRLFNYLYQCSNSTTTRLTAQLCLLTLFNLTMLDLSNKCVTYLFFKLKHWNRLAAIISISLISNFSYGEIYIGEAASTTSASVATSSASVTVEGGDDNKLKINKDVAVTSLYLGKANTQTNITQLDNYGEIGILGSESGIFNGSDNYSASIGTLNNHSGATITSIKNKNSSSIATINNDSGARITYLINDGSSSIATLDNSGKIDILRNGYNTSGSIETINNRSEGVITLIENKYLSSIEDINNYSGASISKIRNYGSSSIEDINNNFGAHLYIVENYGSSSIATLDNSGTITQLYNGDNSSEGTIDAIKNNSGAQIINIGNNSSSSIGTVDNSGKIGTINNDAGSSGKIDTIKNNSGAKIDDICNQNSSSITTLDNSGKINEIYNGYNGDKTSGNIDKINNSSGGVITYIENNSKSTIGTLNNIGSSSIGLINNSSGSQITAIRNLDKSKIGLLENEGTIGSKTSTAITTEGELTLINTGVIEGKDYAIKSSGYLLLNQNAGGRIIGGSSGAIKTSGSGALDLTLTTGSSISGLINLSGTSAVITTEGNILDGIELTAGTLALTQKAGTISGGIKTVGSGGLDLTQNAGTISGGINTAGTGSFNLTQYTGSSISGLIKLSGVSAVIYTEGDISDGIELTAGTLDLTQNACTISGGIKTAGTGGVDLTQYTGSSISGLIKLSGVSAVIYTEGDISDGIELTVGTLDLTQIAGNIKGGIKLSGTSATINTSGDISDGIELTAGDLNLTQNTGSTISGGIKIAGAGSQNIKILGGEVIGDISFDSIGSNTYEQSDSIVTGNISLISGSKEKNNSILTNATIDGTFAFIGALTLNGQSNITNFDLKNGSTLFLGTLPVGGAYISAANASIGTGTKIKVIQPSEFVYDEAVNIVKSDNILNLDLNALTTDSPFSLFNISSATDTNFLLITKTKKAVIEIKNSDPNLDHLLKAAKDQLQNNPELEDELVALPKDAQAKALTTLLPTTSVTSGRGALMATKGAANNINQHLNLNRSKFGNSGISTGDKSFNSMGWGQAFASNTEQKDLGLIEGYSLNTYGFTLGFDNTYLNENNLIGGAFSYSDTSVKLSDLGSSKTDISSYQFAIYSSHYLTKSLNNLFKDLYVDLTASYSFNKNKSRREVVVGGFKKSAQADFNSHELSLYSELGFKKQWNETWSISPSVSLNYSYLRTPTYSETGADNLNLTVSPESMNSMIVGRELTGA